MAQPWRGSLASAFRISRSRVPWIWSEGRTMGKLHTKMIYTHSSVNHNGRRRGVKVAVPRSWAVIGVENATGAGHDLAHARTVRPVPRVQIMRTGKSHAPHMRSTAHETSPGIRPRAGRRASDGQATPHQLAVQRPVRPARHRWYHVHAQTFERARDTRELHAHDVNSRPIETRSPMIERWTATGFRSP
jgi:hypothetical protein